MRVTEFTYVRALIKRDITKATLRLFNCKRYAKVRMYERRTLHYTMAVNCHLGTEWMFGRYSLYHCSGDVLFGLCRLQYALFGEFWRLPGECLVTSPEDVWSGLRRREDVLCGVFSTEDGLSGRCRVRRIYYVFDEMPLTD